MSGQKHPYISESCCPVTELPAIFITVSNLPALMCLNISGGLRKVKLLMMKSNLT